MSVGLPPTTCDIWNTGSYHAYDLGPTGKGNSLVVYDPNLDDFKVITLNVADIITTDIDHCWINGVADQAIQVGNTHIVAVELTGAGGLRVQHTPVPLTYLRADPQSGVMTAPYGQKWTVVGQFYRHPTFGIQGQAGSEYLIGRHDLWTVGLVAHPASNVTVSGITNTVPGDSQWHELDGTLDFCTWADRLPPSCATVTATVFGSWVGQSVQIGIGRNASEAAAFPAAETCNNTSGAINLTASYPISGGQSDGYVSLKTFARCNAVGSNNYMRIGYAYNSTAGIGIWF